MINLEYMMNLSCQGFSKLHMLINSNKPMASNRAVKTAGGSSVKYKGGK